MSEISSDKKRILKNTIFLYLRMFVTMAVSLYTSRVILNTLGVNDYGIYNVVAGLILIVSFVSGAMSSSTQRFITFTLGKGDSEELSKVFSASVQVHLLISIIILILCETIGLWFLLNKLVIPETRLDAAIWAYHFSILGSLIGLITIPFTAYIIAHERMSIFAYISVFDVSLKLLVAIILIYSPIDKLKTYSVLVVLVQFITMLLYWYYCKKSFAYFSYTRKIDFSLFKRMGAFAGWSLIGNMAGTFSSQGVNLLLNIFYGPIINAARGIAVQVQGIIQQFVSNFQVALNPQITKSYAQGNLQEMHSLIFMSARLSFFLMYFLTLPILLETEWILRLWLGNVPDYTPVFTRIMICIALLYTVANPYIIANQATGKLKKYQLVCGGTLMLILPFSYLALKLGMHVYTVFVIQLIIELVTLLLRIIMLRKLIDITLRQVFKNIFVPIVTVAMISFILPYVLYILNTAGLYRFLLVTISSLISVGTAIYVLGLTPTERVFIKTKLLNILKRN